MIHQKWKSKINNRLLNSFFWDNDGYLTKTCKKYMRQPGASDLFPAFVLPFFVQYEYWNEKEDCSTIDNDWMKTNLNGAWTIFGQGLWFELERDAILFKLFFC